MATFENTDGADPLLPVVVAEKARFLQSKAHLPTEQQERLWSDRLSAVLEFTSTVAVPPNGNESSDIRRLRVVCPGRSQSLASPMGAEASSVLNSHNGVKLSREYSRQSAPAAVAVPMSRSPSQLSSCFAAEPAPHASAGAAPPRTFASSFTHPGTAITAWQSQNDEPFTTYTAKATSTTRRAASQRQALAQVQEHMDDLSGIGECPNEYFARNGLPDTLGTPPSVALSPSTAVSRPDSRRPQNPHRLSVSSDRPSALGNPYPLSPQSMRSTAELTNGTTITDMSRTGSAMDGSICDGFDMIRLQSAGVTSFASDLSMSGEVFYGDLKQSSSNTDDGVRVTEFKDSSLDIRGTGSFSEGLSAHSFSQQHERTGTMPAGSGLLLPPSEATYMQRTTSSGSTASTRSDRSVRSAQRRSQYLINGKRPLAPKSSDEGSDMSRQSSSNTMMHDTPAEATMGPKEKKCIIKAQYRRPPRPKTFCNRCEMHPDGFRGEHELRRHFQREHSGLVRKAWMCLDVSEDKSFLAKCKPCSQGKKYGAYYNAAAHLRRHHFHPRRQGRGSRGRASNERSRRAGNSGGHDPPMSELKRWMTEVNEYVADNNVPVTQDTQRPSEDNIDDAENMTIEEPYASADQPLGTSFGEVPDYATSFQHDVALYRDINGTLLRSGDASTLSLGAAAPSADSFLDADSQPIDFDEYNFESNQDGSLNFFDSFGNYCG
ncbi:MAG: hypothetical protein M1833_004386 [Piccolia ochrophora]|nr:MAG: hypothetical protein M1833_004386 [Piccolia ochrophora]